MAYEDQLGDTLAMVNVARHAFGKDMLTDLPDSRPGDSSDCLFYRALADVGVRAVGGDSMEFDDPRKASYIASLWGVASSGTTVKSPVQFREVIGAFDSHKLDHYESGAKPHF